MNLLTKTAFVRKRMTGWKRLSFLIASLSLLLGTFAFGSSPAFAYSCGDASSGHCYAYADSPLYLLTGSSLAGTHWNEYIDHLQCNACAGGPFSTTGFIDDETWFGQGSSYWVEAGYWTVSNFNSTTDDYFWADKRPIDCGTCINVHDFGAISSATFGHTDTFYIARDSGNPTQYDVSIHVATGGSLNGNSTNNTMVPDDIQMGQELAGNAGASAPNVRFSYRYYRVDTTGSYFPINGSYNLYYKNPPYIDVVAGNPGMDFYTHCC